ncbi:Quinoprotein glucose dehydrogenase B precursor [Rubripirellula lacrimiformis]|uniref:Quinoprotein glucose dehydrogenase B n=1 Tax=Rubripirellula lacrimiformis TaxID=1930273 RepID=A0A517NJZ1_9BACT|nr:PQQ-dependent sugar dehydrogenase [Rubripirellula lacrimiformis]QDT07446.1 Quinoprotein glucose dehydrogenase B precursor [Rubripirellula lacrimiformis]
MPLRILGFVALCLAVTTIAMVVFPRTPVRAPYVIGKDGQIVVQAEQYHAKTAANGNEWIEAPTNSVLPNGVNFENASGSGNKKRFMQLQSSNGSFPATYRGTGSGASMDYEIHFEIPGIYRLYLRWDGYDGASDSIYAGFVELADGVGGENADWYEDSGHVASDFEQSSWDGLGEAEVDAAVASQNAMKFTIPSSGTYTLRIVGRENGVSLDALRIQLASLGDPNSLSANGENIVIGKEDFSYNDGPIADQSGGLNWDFNNSVRSDSLNGSNQRPSKWEAVEGVSWIATNQLNTQESAVIRAYGFPDDGIASVNQGSSTRWKSVYYRVSLTRASGATWCGISSCDSMKKRVFFGVPSDPDPASGVRAFAVSTLDTNYSAIVAEDDKSHTLVTKVDFANDVVCLWVDPDLSQPEPKPDAAWPYLGEDSSSAVSLSSGGSAPTSWDDLCVGTSWSAIQRAFPQRTPASNPDVVIANENFDYRGGTISGLNGGVGWDFDNENGDGFVGHTQQVSAWSNVYGKPFLFSGRLGTEHSSAKRGYGSSNDDCLFSSNPSSAFQTLYYRFEMQRTGANITWSGMSVYDDDTERFLVGVPFAANSSSGQRELGIHDLGNNTYSYSGIEPEPDKKFQIVAKVNFATNLVSMFVNPDFTQEEPTKPSARLAIADLKSNAIRFGSDSDEATYWDRVVVATSWKSLQSVSYPVSLPTEGLDLTIGSEKFDYLDGSIGTQEGGQHWDFQNTKSSEFSNDFSDWDVSFGSPTVEGGILRTREAGALRQFNGVESEGAINASEKTSFQKVYVRFDMTRSAGASWSGMSLFDFENERLLFGVPTAKNPASNAFEFAVLDTSAGHTYSGVRPTDGESCTIVAKLDYVADTLSMWIEPDMSLPEDSNTPAIVRSFAGDYWTTALRLGSGGPGPVDWDNLAVGTSWRGIQNAIGPLQAMADSITMRHSEKVRLDVLQNDVGAGTIEIVDPPANGDASIDSQGRVSYHHINGTPANDSLTYRLVGVDGEKSAASTVTFDFAPDQRIQNVTSIVPLLPPATEMAVIDAIPGVKFASPTCFAFVPDTNKLVVGERGGKIWMVPSVIPTGASRQLFLDLAMIVNSRAGEEFTDDGNELCLKSIAFHPDFTTNRQFFVAYCLKVNGQPHVRISRFTARDENVDFADPTSEQPLISQFNPSPIHNLNSCRFGPDGYFYFSSGDAGGLGDDNDNAQHIDKDFWAGIFRIDVDRLPTNLEPNAHPSIALDQDHHAFFKVPVDNPFVDAATFNGLPLSGNVRTEFQAVGFRNPWQFSFDPNPPHQVWVADVGLHGWEEIDLVDAGGNYGWPYLEGRSAGVKPNPPAGLRPSAPIWTYLHGNNALEGNSVTGGLVYRGNNYNRLGDKYIFADFGRGHIWALSRNGDHPPTVERITGQSGIVAFTLDPNSGDILLLDYLAGRVRRLISQTVDTVFPVKLSDTGLFADLGDLSVNPGIERYDINLPFWSDFAHKTRWFMLPNETDTFGYAENGAWSAPTGALWIKHFAIDQTRGDASTEKRLETRLLVRTSDGVYGVSYRWNDDESDAYLVSDQGANFDLMIDVDGSYTPQHWRIPSRSECLTCHTSQAGYSLSFETRQLNRSGILGNEEGNYIQLLADTGYLSVPAGPVEFDNLPIYVTPTDASSTLEARARSWLAVNCAYCHQAGGTGRAKFDLRAQLSLAATDIINGDLNIVHDPADRAIVPGDIPHSAILRRIAGTSGFTRMPPLATSVVDASGIQCISDWINQGADLPSSAQSKSLDEMLPQ